MEELYFEVEKTRTGRPAIWVGGGSTSNKFRANFVLRNGKLANPIFIRVSGHRCNGDQCLVGLQKGDILVDISGRRPASPINPDIYLISRRITDFENDNENRLLAKYEFVDLSVDDIPPSVWEGSNIYHNRDGTYFVGR